MAAKKKAARRGPKYKFPEAKERSQKYDSVLCPSDRVLSLYNDAHETEKQNIAKGVRDWFEKKAYAEKWDGVTWLPEVATGNSGGCVMWVHFGEGASTSITFTASMVTSPVVTVGK
jgi:hypothetical protein